jgi:hypothetical protein
MSNLVDGEKACELLGITRKTLLSKEYQYFDSEFIGKAKHFYLDQINDYLINKSTQKSRLFHELDSEHQIIKTQLEKSFRVNLAKTLTKKEFLANTGVRNYISILDEVVLLIKLEAKYKIKEIMNGSENDFSEVFNLVERKEVL